MENVTKKYKKQVIVEDINLKLKKGTITSLLGNNGSGKTTIINLIAGFTRL